MIIQWIGKTTELALFHASYVNLGARKIRIFLIGNADALDGLGGRVPHWFRSVTTWPDRCPLDLATPQILALEFHSRVHTKYVPSFPDLPNPEGNKRYKEKRSVDLFHTSNKPRLARSYGWGRWHNQSASKLTQSSILQMLFSSQ